MSLQIPTRVRELVYTRDGHRCARCSASIVNIPSSVHHRVPRRMGGSRDPRINDPRNLVRICGTGTTGCHGSVESFREQARVDGWLLRSLDDLDRPLRTLWGAVVELHEDGTRTDDWPTEEAPS